jgi:membrane protein YdbS with pleckstrin-like domain
MNCPKCKATIEPDSFFCKHCGASIGAGGAAPAAPQPVVDAAATAAAAPRTGLDPSRDPAQEKEIWQGRPSWRSSFGAWALWFVGSIAGLILTWKYTDQGNSFRSIVAWLALAAGIGLVIHRAVVVYGQLYRLTTQRLFIHHGILSRVTDQMELVRVDDVRLRQGLMDRVMNTGDVEIQGTDKSDQNVVLESINTPAEVAEFVRRQVRMTRGKGTLFVENV